MVLSIKIATQNSIVPILPLSRSPRPYFLEMGVWRLLGCGVEQEDTAPMLQQQGDVY